MQDVDRFNDIFDEMIKLRHQCARNAGFRNYRDFVFKKMHRFDYTPRHCEDFHEACEKAVVPLLRRLNRERQELLGVDSLRPWDLAVDVRGREPLKPFDSPAELVDRTERIFRRMDESLGRLFARLREPGCLDLETRKGKAPGGYQYERDRSRQPFIFMNAAGVHRDVDTMLHEGGHAFHSMLSEHEPLLHYRHPPMEFCEVASMSMELTAHPFMSEFYDEADANRAVREHLEGVIATLPWIATIDAFQHWLYTNPEHSRSERESKWIDLTDRFGPAVDHSGIETYRPNSWQRQLHLFGVPFYYIEYGIAQLGALQLWLQYKNDRAKAIANYRHALSLGGARPLPELFKAAGLRFDFGPETVRTLVAAVEDDLQALPA
jgi:oligoendopeptidase F